jgi:hypothetical protein
MQDDPDFEYNPQVELEAVARAADKGAALSALSRDPAAMQAFGKWYADDPVGVSTMLARISQEKPKLHGSVAASFRLAVEAQALGVGRRAAGSVPVMLSSLLPHAQGDDLMVPMGYTLESAGTFLLDKKRGKTLICHYPIILEGYVRDQESGASLVVVAWRAAGTWRFHGRRWESLRISPG